MKPAWSNPASCCLSTNFLWSTRRSAMNRMKAIRNSASGLPSAAAGSAAAATSDAPSALRRSSTWKAEHAAAAVSPRSRPSEPCAGLCESPPSTNWRSDATSGGVSASAYSDKKPELLAFTIDAPLPPKQTDEPEGLDGSGPLCDRKKEAWAPPAQAADGRRTACCAKGLLRANGKKRECVFSAAWKSFPSSASAIRRNNLVCGRSGGCGRGPKV
mmetsp:Transcript_104892/g.301866  ORF Transcript_104892/g.301866 Transcript_104892/m.301866 type:complete len:215 (+) Transcript_104892:3499-4143(+)